LIKLTAIIGFLAASCLALPTNDAEAPQKSYQYETKTYDQRVDHFSFTNDETFKQQYLINTESWDKNNSGPIFFYTGNEGKIEAFAENSGFIWDIAPEFKAMVVFAEHRYYGKSKVGNQDKGDYGYLNSEQALADYAQFITHLKSEYGAEKSPVIAFGGSYGGMLAAWFRIKYPHICDGAIATSAPVNQFATDCHKPFQIITKDFADAVKGCDSRIRSSWTALDNVAKKPKGLDTLSTKFNMCDGKKLENVEDLKGYLNNMYFNLAMMDYPYPTSFMTPLPGNPINETCKNITSSTKTGDEDIVDSIASATTNIYLNGNCLDLSHEDDLGANLWGYQYCSEMYMPMCSDGVKDMFNVVKFDYDDYVKSCQKDWKVTPRPNMAEIMYGGDKLQGASNIVFSNGDLDPWSAGGILKDVNPSVVAIKVEGGAHHLDLRGHNEADPQSVIEARKIEKQHINKWIQEANKNGRATNVAAPQFYM